MGKSKGSTTTTQKSEPWQGVQPFLLGNQTRTLKDGVTPIYSQGTGGNVPYSNLSLARFGDTGSMGGGGKLINPDSDYQTTGTPGIFQSAADMYQKYGYSPDQSNLNSYYQSRLMGRENSGVFDDITKGARDVMGGYLDPNISAVGDINPQKVNPGSVNLDQARMSQGQLNPTDSLARLLSGRVNTQYLDPMAQSITNQITRNTTENVLPAIRSQSLTSGQYGGSRQGIAEGLAASRLNQDLSSGLAPLYGQAYESAQNRMMGTAGALNDQAVTNATNNVNRDFAGQNTNVANNLNAQQFNANLGLQNNQQEMMRQAQNLNNRTTGLQALSQGFGMQDQQYGNAMGTLEYPSNYDWNNLNRYASIIQPGSGMGGSAQSTAPNNTNPIAGALGGAIGGGSLASMMGVGGPWGIAAGAGLGLLGGLF